MLIINNCKIFLVLLWCLCVMCCGFFILSGVWSSEQLGCVSHLANRAGLYRRANFRKYSKVAIVCVELPFAVLDLYLTPPFYCWMPFKWIFLWASVFLLILVRLMIKPGNWKWQGTGEASLTVRFRIRVFDTETTLLFLALEEVHSEPDDVVTETQNSWFYRCSHKPQLLYWSSVRGNPPSSLSC